MTSNIPAALFNVLLAGFFVMTALAAAIGIYAARALKKAEQKD